MLLNHGSLLRSFCPTKVIWHQLGVFWPPEVCLIFLKDKGLELWHSVVSLHMPHWSAAQVPVPCFPVSPLVMLSGSSRRWLNHVSSCHPPGRHRWSFWFLAPGWCSPDSWRHLGCDPTDLRSFSLK